MHRGLSAIKGFLYTSKIEAVQYFTVVPFSGDVDEQMLLFKTSKNTKNCLKHYQTLFGVEAVTEGWFKG